MKHFCKTYLVDTQINILKEETVAQTYEIKASSKQEAENICKNRFSNESISNILIRKKESAVPAIILFTITILLSFLRYFEPNGFDYICLFPEIRSVILSCIIYTSFVVRVKKIDACFKTFSDFLTSILFITVLAIYINVFVGTDSKGTGIISFMLDRIGLGNNYPLIVLAIIISWIGIKQLCCFVWMIVAFLGVIEFSTCGEYMGVYVSWLFILSSFLGFIMFLKYENACVRQAFCNAAFKTGRIIKSELDECKSSIIKNNTIIGELKND